MNAELILLILRSDIDVRLMIGCLQLLRQRVRMLTQQLQSCAAAHSRLQRQLQADRRHADARCARLQQQVQLEL